jgi:inositol transport system ATP-binding protein
MAPPLLKVSSISRRFPGVQALDGVSLEVMAGEVHGLLGENGAGKSTLLKILSGADRPDAGTIEYMGQTLRLDSPHHGQSLGIVTIYQEVSLFPSLSVAENIFIGRQPGRARLIDWRRMREQCRALTDRLGLALDPAQPVSTLSVAEQQMVEIARALSMDSRLIIMDEPTSALSDTEVRRLFQIINDLKAQGIGIVFVTHRLEEVPEICDRVTVLRDGRKVGEGAVGELDTGAIIRMMVGRDVDKLFKRRERRAPGKVALAVHGLTRLGGGSDAHRAVLDDISFSLRAGEILGLAGLVGAGRTDLARAIFGADPIDRGRIEIDGKPAAIASPVDAIGHGIGLLPEDRKQQALFLNLAVRTNFSIAALGKLLRWKLFVSDSEELRLMERYRKSLNIRMAGPEQVVANVSGGNQQKVVLARWLALEPKVLIVDEPTRGIDVAAKAEVHQLLDEMAAGGMAIIVISSELPEILAVSDRIITMREGAITGEIAGDEGTEEKLMQMMTLGAQQAA